MKKVKSVSKLKKKADKIFSEFIRSRDRGVCFTCGKVDEWKYQDAGQFVTRGCEELRFNEKNVHCQCKRCNIWKGGEKIVYTLKMQRIYGMKMVNEFESIKFKSHKHWKISELEEIINKYKKKVDKLKKEIV